MKNITKFFGACAAVALFSACSNEEALVPGEDQVPEGMYKVSVNVNEVLFTDETGKKRVNMGKDGKFRWCSDGNLAVIYKGANNATKIVMFEEGHEAVDAQESGVFQALIDANTFSTMTPTDVYSEHTGTWWGNETEDLYKVFNYTQKNVEDLWNGSDAVCIDHNAETGATLGGYNLHLHGKPNLIYHVNNKKVTQFSATLTLDIASYVHIDKEFLPVLDGEYENYYYTVTVLGTVKGQQYEQEYTITCKTNKTEDATEDSNGEEWHGKKPSGGLGFFVHVPEGGIESPVVKVKGEVNTVNLVTKKNKNLEPAKRYKLGTEEYFATTGTAKATINYSNVDVKWVQLWEDGPKFAECNVGTSTDYPNGRFYAWGATYDNGSGYTSTGNLDCNDYQYDTAHNIWGENWRMPTKKEFEDLLTKANCTWTDNYKGQGQKGFLCTGKSGTEYESNEVFFPANGYLIWESDAEATAAGTRGCYWSSTNSGGYGDGYNLNFYSNMNPSIGTGTYCNVRAVLKK